MTVSISSSAIRRRRNTRTSAMPRPVGGVSVSAAHSTANREMNRDFRRNRTSTPIFASDQHADRIGYSRIPYATEQGISKRVSGNFFKEQGNLVKLQRNRCTATPDSEKLQEESRPTR